jgi:hypothetical protein
MQAVTDIAARKLVLEDMYQEDLVAYMKALSKVGLVTREEMAAAVEAYEQHVKETSLKQG